MKLTFENAYAVKKETAQPKKKKAQSSTQDLVRLLCGPEADAAQHSPLSVPHITMYLTLQLQSEAAREEVRVCSRVPRKREILHPATLDLKKEQEGVSCALVAVCVSHIMLYIT